MGVVLIDGNTVRDFVASEDHFNRSVEETFALLDVDKDGVLSRSELRRAFENLRLLDADFGVDTPTKPDEVTKLHNSIFDKFDGDHNGTVDLEEYRSEVRTILLAIADGLGSSPIQMALEDHDHQSFLRRAAELEASKLANVNP
ncbi:unnamed protein product [Linum tenue]|uniref:EF-hand domain-containing protein n=2 Tax=Linum TaxID=4005 RepID=A0AAV0GVY7_9ROSI|nr:unnamed protein product [Linum tenue]CAI0377170.1 unnamed protein product [Linum tenue]CAI0377190.1 unnamed protein product [Linum tenue]